MEFGPVGSACVPAGADVRIVLLRSWDVGEWHYRLGIGHGFDFHRPPKAGSAQ
jgi:hypothetical protein